jgi:pimeloyl-ACP methyl ester carboxylesterase
MPYSRANGVDIWYEDIGAGPVIVLVHANPFDNQMWVYQASHFANFFRIINIDLRGYGRSAKMVDDFTLEDMARDVLGVMQDAKVDSAIFMGCSVGSTIGILLGLDHPNRFHALILVGGSSDRSLRFPTRIDGYLNNFPEYHRRFIEDLVHPSFPNTIMGRYFIDTFLQKQSWLSPQAVAATLRATNSTVLTDRLSRMKVPTLVINGEVDNARPGGELTSKLIPNAEHRVIEGAGHACCLEDPVAFDRLVIEYLQRKRLWPADASTT